MTKLELERVASLANHPGFKALLKLLDEADAELLVKLETAAGDTEQSLLNLWRGSRRFKKLIQNTPNDLMEELGIHVFEDFQ